MSDLSSLSSRIDAEFTAVGERHRKGEADQRRADQERQERMEKLGQVFDRLRDIWKPRLEMLVKKFGDRVHVTPRIIPAAREAAFEFQSNVARIRLRFSATTDRDVTKVILSSDLDIVPVLWRFDRHAELEFPLDQVDPDEAAKWVDERILAFVKTYLSINETEFHLKDQMVEDPVTGVRFPKFAAGATLNRDGKTYYFLGEESRAAFEKKK